MSVDSCFSFDPSRMDSLNILNSLELRQRLVLESMSSAMNVSVLDLLVSMAMLSTDQQSDHDTDPPNVNHSHCVKSLISLAIETWEKHDPRRQVTVNHDISNLDYVEYTQQKQPYVIMGLICSMLMIVVAVIGIIGNAVSVWYFGKFLAKSSINIMLTAMAVFDCILLFTGAPLYSLVGIHSYTGYDYLIRSLSCCLGYFYTISTMSQTATAWMLVLITFERYIAVCRPFLARRLCTIGRAVKAVIGVSAFALCYNLIRLWEFESDSVTGDARPLLRNHPYYRSIYMHWMYLTLVFLVPFSIIAFFNAMIIRAIRTARIVQRACRVHSGCSEGKRSGQGTHRLQAEHRTAVMLLMVVLVFMACEVLAPILNALEMVGGNNDPAVFAFLSDLNNLLVLLHSAVNVGIYVGFCSEYRRVCRLIMQPFRRLFCCYRRKPIITVQSANALEFSIMDGLAWRHRASVASVNGIAFSHSLSANMRKEVDYIGLERAKSCYQLGTTGVNRETGTDTLL